jgi:hypothetical protein
MTDTSQLAVSLLKLNEKIGDMEINAQTIMTVTRFSMEIVESTKLKGAANTIELIVDVSKGDVDINTVVAVASGCCSALLKSRK